jgi:UDP-3-O-[3-hydroxymyristoyl] glucosamine N-acyltransferase
VADERHAKVFARSDAAACVAAREELAGGRPAVVVENAMVALALLLEELFRRDRPPAGVSERATVHSSARLGRDVAVAAGAWVGEEAEIGDRAILGPGAVVGRRARIGEDTELRSHVVVEDGCRVGARCLLHAGVVIGADGFGFVWDGNRHRKIPQVGTVVIEDDVEIGANAAIDRATLDATLVGRGTKIDNLVQIGHNCTIGEDCLICGQTGIAGSSVLERRVTLAGQVGLAGHLTIGEGATVTAQGGVFGTIDPKAIVTGMPAVPHREFLARMAALGRLPAALKTLAELGRRVARLETKDSDSGKG